MNLNLSTKTQIGQSFPSERKTSMRFSVVEILFLIFAFGLFCWFVIIPKNKALNTAVGRLEIAKEEQKKAQTTKDFVQLAEIRDTILVLKDGSLRSIVEISSTNFELKSADEQTAIIQGFQGFLNSIDFPLQILVNSRKLDIGPYLKSLDGLTESLKNELLKIQAAEYARFIKSLTELTNIMAKKFYIVIPFYVIEAVSPTKAGFFSAIKGAIIPSKFVKTLTEEELETYKAQIGQRIGIVAEGLSGLGLQTKTLAGDELMNLFYSYYNPGEHL